MAVKRNYRNRHAAAPVCRRSFLNNLVGVVAVAVFSLPLLLGTFCRAADSSPKHLRLLAIGNSFSGNATHYLPGIVDAAGDKLTFRTISIGGCPLERHWQNADAFQHGSTNALARAWTALSAEPWDFITIQQFSGSSYKLETYRPYAKQLHDYIKQQCPKSEVVIHETWAYREDDPLFRNGFTQQDMYWGLRKAYETIAREIDCRIIPVGDAFENAVIESFWARLETELLNRKKWKTRIELSTALFEYLEIFHNRTRRHKRVAANCYAADYRSVGTDRSTAANECVLV